MNMSTYKKSTNRRNDNMTLSWQREFLKKSVPTANETQSLIIPIINALMMFQ